MKSSANMMLTSGGGLIPGLAQTMTDKLMAYLFVPDHPQFNEAIGVAMIAGSIEL